MSRSVRDIKSRLESSQAKSTWEKGIKAYALDLFYTYLDMNDIIDEDAQIDRITQENLLCGAKDWQTYSHGGFSLIRDEEICERLCSPSGVKRFDEGRRRPSKDEEWLDVQARALDRAAYMLINAVNN